MPERHTLPIMMKSVLAFLIFSFSCYAGAVESTETRIWTSKGGNKITAKATELTPNGSVQLITKDGRELTLGIDELSKADQAFLEEHFGKNAAPQAPTTGHHHGPLKADADTSYYLYLPKDFDPKVRSPVMVWTQSDGAQAGTLERFSEAADLLGMVIASPVEARHEGGVTLINNLAHTRSVLSKLEREYSLERKAVHFGGDKSGAAAAFQNSIKIKSAGTFTVSGYLTPNMTAVNEGHHFMAGSTNSSYRYLTAWAAAKFGEEGTHFLYEGAREMPDSRDIAIGMVWMYAQGLYAHPASRSEEIAAFEERILPWLKELTKESEGDAAFLTRMLTSECTLRGAFKQEIDQLHQTLSQDPAAVAHVKGREALDEFSEKELSKFGNHYSPLPEHAPKSFERITTHLAEKYQKAEDLQAIFKQLAEPTHR